MAKPYLRSIFGTQKQHDLDDYNRVVLATAKLNHI